MAGTKAVGQLQGHGTLDQKRSAQFGAFGDEDPAHCLAQAWLAQRAWHGCRYFGVEVGEVQAGLFGAAALGQVGDDGDQLRVLVQGLQLGLEQVLGDDEAGEAFAAVEGRVGLDQGIQLGVRGMGDLVQALGAQGWAFGHGAILGKRGV
ncbi:hypothetical protein D3C77_594400 [compost metagenome]